MSNEYKLACKMAENTKKQLGLEVQPGELVNDIRRHLAPGPQLEIGVPQNIIKETNMYIDVNTALVLLTKVKELEERIKVLEKGGVIWDTTTGTGLKS